MRTLITVSQCDIENGLKEHPCLCPLASAIRRKLGLCSVGNRFAQLLSYDTPLPVRLPEAARNFVWSFDKGKTVKPFKFFLYHK